MYCLIFVLASFKCYFYVRIYVLYCYRKDTTQPFFHTVKYDKKKLHITMCTFSILSHTQQFQKMIEGIQLK